MASFKGYDREDGQKRRQGQRKARRNGIPRIEFLEMRQLLTGGPSVLPAPLWTPSDPRNLLDAQNGPMANLGAGTVDIYAAYVHNGGNTSQLAAEFPTVEFQNGMVGLQVKSLGGDFSSSRLQLTDAGMQITTASSYYGLVEGFAPINELPTIAELHQTMSGQINYKPTYLQEYQGIAYNEAETSMFADVARTEFNVDGTGVTIGVISDSVNQYVETINGVQYTGLAASYANRRSQPERARRRDLRTVPTGGTDEGRAMLENIHDVAPGASLAFATAGASRSVDGPEYRGAGYKRQGQYHRRRRQLSATSRCSRTA